MNSLITPSTITEHLQRIKDAEALYAKFGKPETLAYLNTLHSQSSDLLTAMQQQVDTYRRVVNAYDEAAKVMKAVRR